MPPVVGELFDLVSRILSVRPRLWRPRLWLTCAMAEMGVRGAVGALFWKYS